MTPRPNNPINSIGQPINRLTVAHIFSGDLWAGAEVMIFNLLKHLKGYPGLDLLAFSLNEGTLTQKLREVGIKTYVVREDKYDFLRIYNKISRILKGQRVDVIHSHRYKENLTALLLHFFFPSARLLATIHGLPESFPKEKTLKSEGISKLNLFILRNYFSRIIAVSEEMKNALVKELGFSSGKIQVIYNGIGLPPEMGAISQNGSRIGTAGRMVRVKDYHLFLDVAAAVTKEAPHVLFSILGDGPLKDQLRKRATELRLDGHVNLLPTQPDPFPYYNSLDLYLNTSLHEGIPMSILEAMACGKPVVAPRVGGIPEIISHTQEGFLIDGRKPEDYAYTCLSLVRNRALRNQMGQAAREKIATDFSASKMAQSYYELYMSIISQQP